MLSLVSKMVVGNEVRGGVRGSWDASDSDAYCVALLLQKAFSLGQTCGVRYFGACSRRGPDIVLCGLTLQPEGPERQRKLWGAGVDEAVQALSQQQWNRIPLLAGIAKTGDACRVRWQCLRHPSADAEWAPEEDARLQAAVTKHGLHEVTSAFTPFNEGPPDAALFKSFVDCSQPVCSCVHVLLILRIPLACEFGLLVPMVWAVAQLPREAPCVT